MKTTITIPSYEIGEVNGFGLCISTGNTLIFTNLESVETAKALLIDIIADEFSLQSSIKITLEDNKQQD